MMLPIMGYAVAVAAVLGGIGLCLERVARLQGLPRRTVWMAVMLLSVLFPAAMILFARPEAVEEVAVHVAERSVPYVASGKADLSESHAAQEQVSAPAAAAAPTVPGATPRSTWKVPLPSDKQLVAAWMVASSVIALYLLGANLLLLRRAAGWHTAIVHDKAVLVSEVTGPALLGAFSPRIVVPRWLLSQPPGTQALILEHERQHMVARDPLLIVAGLFLIAAVPWNVPLWWQWRRMRQAIELDCDARVLCAGAEANTYAQVLLSVTQRAVKVPPGALAMSEPATALERRIESLVPDAFRFVRLQTIAVLALAMTGAGVAVALDAPALPARAAPAVLVAAPRTVPAQVPATSFIPLVAAQVTIPAATPPAVPPVPGVETAPAVQLQAIPPSAGPPIVVRIFPPRTTYMDTVTRKVVNVDAAVRVLMETYRTALAEKLRAAPGLTVLTPAASWRDLTADHDINIEFLKSSDTQGISVQMGSPQPEGTRALPEYFHPVQGMSLVPDPGKDLAWHVDRSVLNIRAELFGKNASFQQELLSMMADRRLEFLTRMGALHHLLMLSYSNGRYSVDPAVIRGAVEFANGAVNPDNRSSVWERLRETRSPELIAPIIQALETEKDGYVRVALVGILETNYRTDPRARGVLDSIARNDPQQLTRLAAQGGPDAAGWNDYVGGTLKNPGLTDAERLAPIGYLAAAGLVHQRSPVLDDEAMRALGSLLASATAVSRGYCAGAAVVLNSTGPVAAEVFSDIHRLRVQSPGPEELSGCIRMLMIGRDLNDRVRRMQAGQPAR